MYLLPVGYPLGFTLNEKYNIERLKSDPIQLCAEELELWISLFSSSEAIKRNELCDRLLSMGVALAYDEKSELFGKIGQLYSFRSGIGWFAREKMCIAKDEKLFYLTKLQHEIWLKSNGYLETQEIYSQLCGENKNEDSVDGFCEAIIYLVKNELVNLL